MGTSLHQTGATTAKPKGGDLRSDRIEAYRDVIYPAPGTGKDIAFAE